MYLYISLIYLFYCLCIPQHTELYRLNTFFFNTPVPDDHQVIPSVIVPLLAEARADHEEKPSFGQPEGVFFHMV